MNLVGDFTYLESMIWVPFNVCHCWLTIKPEKITVPIIPGVSVLEQKEEESQVTNQLKWCSYLCACVYCNMYAH